MNKLKKFKISQINKTINDIIELNLYILFEIEGDVSNLSIIDNNAYLTLKDGNNSISAIIWNDIFHKNSGIINGDRIKCEAFVKCYSKNSKFHLLIKKYEKIGEGHINLKLNSLKTRLMNEGIFNNKKKINKYNVNIAIITSIHGAALKDIISVIKKNNNCSKVLIHDTRVQGNNTVESVCNAIKNMNIYSEKMKNLIDVIIISRGGGSTEDLFYFNNEQVVRSIYASEIPIISGIGHQHDRTLSDSVSDRYAITPSIAAEIASFDSKEVLYYLNEYHQRIDQLLEYRYRQIQNRLNIFKEKFLKLNPLNLINQNQKLLNENEKLLEKKKNEFLEKKKNYLLQSEKRIDDLNPINILKKGYCLILDPDGNIIDDINVFNALSNMELKLIFSNGSTKLNNIF